MPVAQVRGVAINYEVIGARGPWVSLAADAISHPIGPEEDWQGANEAKTAEIFVGFLTRKAGIAA